MTLWLNFLTVVLCNSLDFLFVLYAASPQLCPWSSTPLMATDSSVYDQAQMVMDLTCGCSGHPAPEITWEENSGSGAAWADAGADANITTLVLPDGTTQVNSTLTKEFRASKPRAFRCVCRNQFGVAASERTPQLPLRIFHSLILLSCSL